MTLNPLEYFDETQHQALAAGERTIWLGAQNNAADAEMRLARRPQAARRLAAIMTEVQAMGDPLALAYFAETFAAAIGPADPVLAARLYGACDALRTEGDMPRSGADVEEDEANVAPLRALLAGEGWAREFEHGRALDLARLLADAEAVAIR